MAAGSLFAAGLLSEEVDFASSFDAWPDFESADFALSVSPLAVDPLPADFGRGEGVSAAFGREAVLAAFGRGGEVVFFIDEAGLKL